MRLGIDHASTGMKLRDALSLISGAGCDCLQIDAAGELLPRDLGPTARRELVTLFRSYNLKLEAIQVPLRRGLDAAERRDERIDYISSALDLATDLGTRVVVLPFPKLPGEGEEARRTLLAETLRDVARRADRLGIRPALEIGFDPAKDVVAFLDGLELPGVGLCLDPANWVMSRLDPVAQIAPAAGRWLTCHGRDARGGSLSRGADEVPLGAGNVNWLSFVVMLSAIDYAGAIVAERTAGDSRAADLVAGIDTLRALLPKPAPRVTGIGDGARF